MPPTTETGRAAFDGVVLAGGAARRLGGVDKPALPLGGVPLLHRVLAALADAERVVVVGPQRPVPREVLWAREEPPGGGPAAAVAAGLAQVVAPVAVVLAGDLPLLDASVVDALLLARGEADGAVLVDDDGREQLLAGCWSTEALRSAVASGRGGDGASVRGLLGGLRRVHVQLDERRPAWLDCDTPDDVRRAEELL